MARALRPLAIVLVLPVLLLAVEADKDTWPLFHGNPQQTGIAHSKLLDKLDVLWKVNTGDSIENAVAVAKGVVYVGSMDEHLYALDLATGAEKWKYKAAPFKAAPAYRDGLVYLGDLDGHLHCVDAAKGEKKWKFEAGSEVGGVNFHGPNVLFASHDEHLYCLDKDGKQLWKFKTDGPIYGAPAVAEGKTFLVGCDSQMHVLDVAKGKEESSVDLGGQTGASPAVLDAQLFIGTMRNEVKAIDWKKAEVLWTYKPAGNAQSFYSSPAVTQKYVVIGARDNRLHCIDRKTGNEAWTFPTGGKVDSSPVVAGSQVVVGSADGKVYVLDLETGKKLQEVKLDGAANASPVVVDGKLLIGTQKGTLYCLGKK